MSDSTIDSLTALRAELSGLTTESAAPRSRDLNAEPTIDLVRQMSDHDAAAVAAVRAAAASVAEAVDGIVERLRAGGRLVYLGAGTSGRLGVLDASECPPTFGTDPSLVVGVIAGGDVALRSAVEGAEDDPLAGEADVDRLEIGAADAVVGISASGRTPYVLGALERAGRLGALTVSIACNRDSAAGRIADVAIEAVVGPEFLAGSTRLGAGTATKLILNMLSTLSMVRLGKTFNGYMVDLRVSNDKLIARAERLVMSLCDVSGEVARDALGRTGGSVAEAVLVLSTGVEPARAHELLEEHASLRAALDAVQESATDDAQGLAAATTKTAR